MQKTQFKILILIGIAILVWVPCSVIVFAMEDIATILPALKETMPAIKNTWLYTTHTLVLIASIYLCWIAATAYIIPAIKKLNDPELQDPTSKGS